MTSNGVDRSHEYPMLTPEPSPTPPQQTQTDKVKAHPYRTTLIVATSLLLLFIIVIVVRIGTYGADLPTTWTGAGGVFFTGGRNLSEQERLSAEATVKQQSPEAQLGYIPINAPSADNFQGDTGGDLGKLLALLSHPEATSSARVDTGTPDGYSYIPQGLISIKDETRATTKEAKALAVYGNEVGTYIEGFESLHGGMALTLKDQAEDRKNPDKAAALKRLGQDFAQLGFDLTVMSTVEIPEEMKAAHKAYATTYRIVGTNLIKISETKTDDEYLKAITAYNDSVDALTKRFLTIVAIFSANNVVFSSNDTGRVFMFNQTMSF